MRERPILFSGPMVRAILEGRKTQTRRIVTGKVALEWLAPEMFTPEYVADPENGLCPFGIPGGRLWVKESIRHLGTYINGALELDESVYVADGEQTVADAWPWKLKTLPAMFCPRGLSRLTLEVKAVRVERLQEISEADAEAEGIEQWESPTGGGDVQDYQHNYLGGVPFESDPVASFRSLWDSINAKRGHGWEANPWVWVVEFERVQS